MAVSFRIFVNGAQVATRPVTGAMPNSTQPLQIGGNKVWPEWFKGQIDDVRVYSRSLSAAELQADMNTPVGGTAPTAPTPPPTTPPDTQAPSTPTGLAVNGQSQTAVTLNWSGSTDNVGVTSYGAYANGAAAGSTAASNRTYTFTGLTCSTSYTLGVDAVDAAGNRSGRATVSAATSACATTPPPPPPSSGATVARVKSWQTAYNKPRPGQSSPSLRAATAARRSAARSASRSSARPATR